ncbi:MAG: rod shape-determining protein MreC [Rubrivivax sp.]|jgi:rod shape-determining protein MreC
MPLGTLDRTPPPFFRQGLSALTKLGLFSALALLLMVADARWRVVDPVRAALATALLPLQRALAVPVEAWEGGGDYLQGLSQALQAESAARAALARQSAQAQRAEQLLAENRQLRALLDLRPALSVKSTAAEILYEAADPYSRKVLIDRGAAHGVVRGAPVINEAGVLGQVTRVYPLTAEVTLLTDRDAAIPVINTRTQQRSAAFGGAGGGANPGMELRFMAGHADVQPGDVLNTSGLDGVYPAGLVVARVTGVERRADAGFARITLAPAALPDGVRHVLVLEPIGLQMPPRAGAAAPAGPAAARGPAVGAAQ